MLSCFAYYQYLFLQRDVIAIVFDSENMDAGIYLPRFVFFKIDF